MLMPCFHPIVAKRVYDARTDSYKIIFGQTQVEGQVLYLPCGQCIGCRIARSREWAARCVHEASLYKENCFITLTYDPEHLPKDGSLHVEHFQNFMKRLRKRFQGKKIRFLHCGEYGSQGKRPHFHALLFGFDFPDKKLFKIVKGNKIYRSAILESLWTDGFSTIGAVTFESCAYVARYVTKKVTGPAADEHYQGRKPEYITMSRRPGVASGWFEKYYSDVFPQDFVVLKDGRKVATPRYYMKQLEKYYPELYDKVSEVRLEKSLSLGRPDFIKDPNDPLKYFHDLDVMYEDFHERARVEKVIEQRIKKRLPRRYECGEKV